MLIIMQKSFQFCIPCLKTPQPVLPYCKVCHKDYIGPDYERVPLKLLYQISEKTKTFEEPSNDIVLPAKLQELANTSKMEDFACQFCNDEFRSERSLNMHKHICSNRKKNENNEPTFEHKILNTKGQLNSK